MALNRFPGGLELTHHKQVALRLPLAEPPLPERFYLPLSDPRGRSLTRCLADGAAVLRGQALTRSDSDFDLVMHAPTSGRLAGTVNHPVAWPPGSSQPCLLIESDGQDRSVEPQPLTEWTRQQPEALIDHLRAMGLAGLGGAAFPTAAKLRGDWPGIDTLILNGAECEPWIACDEILMRERASAIITGGQILARAAEAGEIIIAIEDQMGEVSRRLKQAMNESDESERLVPIRLVQVPSIYPEGGERQLIQVLTGQEVPHDGLPQDLGLLCHNVATAAAAFDATVQGWALTERIVTVTGPGVSEPRNLVARIGTRMADLLAAAGGISPGSRRLILGGPMSGLALASDQIPVTKGSNCLLVLEAEQLRARQPTMPCINCGECVRVCPASLLPQQLFRLIEGERYEQAAALNLFDCIECGCCAQVCPSHIPLVDWYRHGKAERRLDQLDQRRAALARRRHEAREQRLEQARAARQARRERRQQRLEEADAARDDIQSAIERARKRRDAET